MRQYIFTFLAPLFLSLASLPATAVECFVTVKSYDELKDGMKCLIVRQSTSANTIMGIYNNGNNFPAYDVTDVQVYSHNIVEYKPSNMSMLYLYKTNPDTEENNWFFKDSSGSFLTVTKYQSNYLKMVDTKDDYCNFSIDIIDTSNYNVKISSITKAGYFIQQNYTSSKENIFSAYSSTRNPVNLFRKLGDYYLRRTAVGNFGTICLPYSVSAKGVAESGAKYYEILGKTMANGAVDGIVLGEVSELKACTPYILYTTGDNAVILPEGTAAETTSDFPTSTGLVGNLSSRTQYAPENSFIIYENEIRLVAKGVKANVLKNYAYITLDDVPEYKGTLPQNAKRMSVMGGTTGITVSEATPDRSPSAYNLAGQPADANTHGIVIVNGRKVIY